MGTGTGALPSIVWPRGAKRSPLTASRTSTGAMRRLATNRRTPPSPSCPCAAGPIWSSLAAARSSRTDRTITPSAAMEPPLPPPSGSTSSQATSRAVAQRSGSSLSLPSRSSVVPPVISVATLAPAVPAAPTELAVPAAAAAAAPPSSGRISASRRAASAAAPLIPTNDVVCRLRLTNTPAPPPSPPPTAAPKSA